MNSVQGIYRRLYRLYGDCACPLEHGSAFQLLAAVMLSSQCRDERVNRVTRELFSVAPDARSMAAMSEEEIAGIIRVCGLYKVKSRNLKKMARMLVERYRGVVPRTMEELIQLPGVGRKSANVLLGNAFGLPGFPADTHVTRLLTRIGIAARRDPAAIEKLVNARLAPELWCNFSHLLITHGRRVCRAINPDCGECALRDICCHAGSKEKK